MKVAIVVSALIVMILTTSVAIAGEIGLGFMGDINQNPKETVDPKVNITVNYRIGGSDIGSWADSMKTMAQFPKCHPGESAEAEILLGYSSTVLRDCVQAWIVSDSGRVPVAYFSLKDNCAIARLDVTNASGIESFRIFSRHQDYRSGLFGINWHILGGKHVAKDDVSAIIQIQFWNRNTVSKLFDDREFLSQEVAVEGAAPATGNFDPKSVSEFQGNPSVPVPNGLQAEAKEKAKEDAKKEAKVIKFPQGDDKKAFFNLKSQFVYAYVDIPDGVNEIHYIWTAESLLDRAEPKKMRVQPGIHQYKCSLVVSGQEMLENWVLRVWWDDPNIENPIVSEKTILFPRREKR